jgi:hypothetical protein
MSVMLVGCVNIMYWKSVFIVSFLSLGNIYEARRMILGCSDGDEKVVASIPTAYIVTSTDPSFSFRKLN